MDAAAALSDLTEISADVQAAVVASSSGEVVAATVTGEDATTLARAGAELVREAGARAVGIEVAAGRTHVLAVRDGARVLAAVASPRCSSELLMYDLRSCLRRVEQTVDEPA